MKEAYYKGEKVGVWNYTQGIVTKEKLVEMLARVNGEIKDRIHVVLCKPGDEDDYCPPNDWRAKQEITLNKLTFA